MTLAWRLGVTKHESYDILLSINYPLEPFCKYLQGNVSGSPTDTAETGCDERE